MSQRFFLDKKQIRRQFDRAAKAYAEHAPVYQEIEARLNEKLDYIRMQPENVLDLGCGVGSLSSELKQRYPDAQIVSVDLSLGMLKQNKNPGIQADAIKLPFANESMDIVISNLMLPWCDNLALVFQEIKRVLKTDGLVLFSTFGPDTFKELRAAWACIDNNPRVQIFFDMHDIGDALLKTNFADPVMDVEHLTVNYAKFENFLKDLKLTGSTNVMQDRPSGLLTKNKLIQLEKNYIKEGNKFLVTYEIAYGHAWKTNVKKTDAPGEFYFPVNRLFS